MIRICRNGHRSTDPGTEFCPVCGHALHLLEPDEPGDVAPDDPAAGGDGVTSCAVCDSPLEPGARYCTVCGDEVGAGPRGPDRAGDPTPGAGGRWAIEIGVSREQWAAMSSSRAMPACPDHLPPRRVPLHGSEITIGRVRRGAAPAVDLPQVNLAALPGQPEDSGISRSHAHLRRDRDGWLLSDSGSKNGVFLNGGFDSRLDGSPCPVGHGDRIHVGAWTVLTLVRENGGA